MFMHVISDRVCKKVNLCLRSGQWYWQEARDVDVKAATDNSEWLARDYYLK